MTGRFTYFTLTCIAYTVLKVGFTAGIYNVMHARAQVPVSFNVKLPMSFFQSRSVQNDPPDFAVDLEI